MHPFSLENRSIVSRSETRLLDQIDTIVIRNVNVAGRIVENILGPSLVCVKCVLRNHAFRIAAAARTRDSQMRVTIDTRRFSANSTNARTMSETHAHRAGKRERIIFLFFFFSFLFFIQQSHYGSTIPTVLLSAICNDACVFTNYTI